MSAEVLIRDLGRAEYLPTWHTMQRSTEQREAGSQDEIWLVEHERVFTQGQAGKPEHLLMPGDIPVVQADRGGQVTYHGPGQLVAYVLLDLKRLGSDVRRLVSALEDSIVDLLAEQGVTAAARPDAPGVYVGERKICSLGLRIKRGFSYHGLALNLDMDLEPFQRINPCGYQGMEMTQLADFMSDVNRAAIQRRWVELFCQRLDLHAQWVDAETEQRQAG
ncbi:lipoyl(octanoyl) transferase LipB [Saccharospirillum mangrovi]|uniref:lipoyl(octanoyl) transferase LipB n=1 Tax=Saccharospirillum mangrovi TaxID=2161747 RepID=UPI000D3D44A0|nr:lipoyl(octanoyl) transferase LipB [Saccharospirillum mangrovi]